MEIRALRKEDERARFSSGDVDLDRFFHKFAGQNQFKHHIGTTYVAVDGGAILGYVTVAPATIEIEELPVAARKKLPSYPLPVLRLARLAVDQAVKGQGVGKQLLAFVLRLALALAKDYGCVGVLVDAKPAAVPFYEKLGFIAVEAIEGRSSDRPEPTPMFLALRSIEAAG